MRRSAIGWGAPAWRASHQRPRSWRVEVPFVVDDVEVPGGLELGERDVGAPFPEGLRRGPVAGVADPAALAQLGGSLPVVLGDDPPQPAGGDRAVLGRVTDEPQGGAVAVGGGEERAEVAVADGGRLVDEQDGAPVGGPARHSVVEYPLFLDLGRIRCFAGSPSTPPPIVGRPSPCGRA